MSEKKTIESFYIESLGCAKNSVDSRSMAELLLQAGFSENQQAENSDLIIVNTCGFIQPARLESLQVLREFVSSKKKGQYIIAAGCLSEREKQQLSQEIQDLDAVMGTRRWADILKVVKKIQQPRTTPYFYFPDSDHILEGEQRVVRAAVQGSSAYLKIADGCDRGCAFCAIPLIKGPMVSRPMADILEDAVYLQAEGIKELILIAQDTTAYGRDLGFQDGLPLLLKELNERAPLIPWIRVMYTYPGMISDELIAVMAEGKHLIPYLDIPLQHAHADMLKRMRRPSDVNWVRDTIQKMRAAIPDLALRTTFIVGFPGETDKEFTALLDFVDEIRFDHVGIFPYYHEEGTSAFEHEDDIPEEVKNERVQRLAGLQQYISLSKNQAWVGRDLDVLIEGNGDGISIGRSFRDAPEIDGLVMLDEIVETGQLIKARMTGALMHDLIAKKI